MNEQSISPVERWVPVRGYEGMYAISDRGRVLILKTNRELKSRGVGQSGYRGVNLYRGRHCRTAYIHSLLLEAFVGPRPHPKAVTRHLNGDHLDNRLVNLAWGTQAENVRDRIDHGRDFQSNKTHCRHGHEFAGANLAPNKQGGRRCRTCNREHKRESRRRLAQRIAA